jgi:taurine dioxygenase
MKIIPLSGAVGAAISGIRLAELSEAEFDQIHEAFLNHCMLAFPEQFLSIDEHVQFAQRWGDFSTSPFVSYLDSHPSVLPLHNRGKNKAVTENWHTDSAFLTEPPALNILSARQVPVGGDTMWSNQYQSYDRLSEGMKDLLDGVRAEFTGARLASLAGSNDIPSTFHPIIRTHPETHRKSLYISKPVDSVPRLEGLTSAESLPLLHYLYDHSTQPDNIYRHHWQNGDVVMWDNRCTLHYAVHDYGEETRDIHRISIKGTVPR